MKKSITLAEMGELFVAFFKIGLFTFGGGLAMLPLIEKEIIENIVFYARSFPCRTCHDK